MPSDSEISDDQPGWRSRPDALSLREVHGTIAVPTGAGLLAQAAGLRRPRLPGGRRLHGPWQLGHGPRGRRALRLHAPQRHPHLQPDGHPAAGARGAPRHRQRPRPGPGLPRQLLQADHARALGAVRDCDRRVRPRRGDRRRHRAQPAVRPSPHLGRLHHRARRAGGALSPEQGVPLRRGARRRAHRRHRRLLRRGTVSGEAGSRRRWRRASSRPRGSSRTRRCSTSRWASSAPP